MDSNTHNPVGFAQDFANLPILGAVFLIRRDLPHLLEKYVHGSKTLDFGCGSGKSSTFLKSLGLDVDGVDINVHMIEFCKDMDPNGNYCVMETGKIPKSDDIYDLVYVANVLPYISTKREMLETVKEIVRVMKQGGALIVAVSNRYTYKHKWADTTTDFEENKNLMSGCIARIDFLNYSFSTRHYFWEREDYLEVFSKAGLDLECIHEPLGKDTDGYSWIDETKVPITTVYILKKR